MHTKSQVAACADNGVGDLLMATGKNLEFFTHKLRRIRTSRPAETSWRRMTCQVGQMVRWECAFLTFHQRYNRLHVLGYDCLACGQLQQADKPQVGVQVVVLNIHSQHLH